MQSLVRGLLGAVIRALITGDAASLLGPLAGVVLLVLVLVVRHQWVKRTG
ncbi:hypothetical protein ACFC1R_08565 [Kitasatospora sp. NPDC056138]